MHSIINSQEKCIGQYLIIEDDTYTTRLFARFYNMCITSKDEAPITEEDVINTRKYREKDNLRNCDIYKLFPKVSHTTIDRVLNYKSYKKIPC